MFGAASKLTSAASKAAGAAANTVSGTVGFAEHEAAKAGGTVAGAASLAGHEAYEVGGTVANTVSGTASFAEHEAAKAGGAVAGTVSGTVRVAEHRAAKVGGAVAGAVSGAVGVAEHGAVKVGGAAAGVVSGTAKVAGHEAYKVGGAVANTVSGAISFSEHQAMKHVRALTGLGSRSAAHEYVHSEFQNIKETAPAEADVDVAILPPRSGSSEDEKSVLLKVAPKNLPPEANKKAVMVTAGANYGVFEKDAEVEYAAVTAAILLELARSLSIDSSQYAIPVYFAYDFNHPPVGAALHGVTSISRQDVGLVEHSSYSYSFMNENPWGATIRLAIDLDGLGLGGKPIISQASVSEQDGGLRNPAIILFDNDGAFNQPKQAVLDFEAMNAKGNPFNIQDVFASEESTNLSGRLSGYELEHHAVYHTKNDKYELLKNNSMQYLGENMLPFLLHIASNDSAF